MEEVVGSIPTRSTKSIFQNALTCQGVLRYAQDFASGLPLSRSAGSLTPAKRLKFDPDQVHQSLSWMRSLAGCDKRLAAPILVLVPDSATPGETTTNVISANAPFRQTI